MARRKPQQSDSMGDEAGQIRMRRERLGMGKAELAREARVSRHTLAAIEKGEGSHRSTLAKIEQALTALEQEAGLDVTPLHSPNGDDLLTVEVELADGSIARVITRDTADPERVAAQVAAILERIRRADNGSA